MRPADIKKDRLLFEQRAKNAFKQAMTFIGKIRDEVVIAAYSSFERFLGDQSEELLVQLDLHIQSHLAFLDKRWKDKFETGIIKAWRPGVIIPLVKHDVQNPDGEKEQGLAQSIRDELLDAMGTYARKMVGIDTERVEAWMSAMAIAEDMQPKALIESAKRRLTVQDIRENEKKRLTEAKEAIVG